MRQKLRRIRKSFERHAGWAALVSLVACLSSASLWWLDKLALHVQTSLGWGHLERHHWLGFSITQIHASAGPILVVFIPDWFTASVWVLATAVLPARWFIRARRRALRRRRAAAGQCPACGYDVRATPLCCPECGATASQSGMAAA